MAAIWAIGLAAALPPVAEGTQELLVFIKLSDDAFGASGEVFSYTELERDLDEKVQARSAGEMDGHESGEGYLTLHFVGPSADRMFRAIAPALVAKPLPAGSYMVKRYGGRRGGRDVRVEMTAAAAAP